MLKKITLATALLAFMGSANAYQFEVGGKYEYFDEDYNSIETAHESRFEIDGTYFFKPVDVGSHPFNEAAFLNKASNVNAYAFYSKFKANYDDDEYSFKVNEYNLGVEYFVPNSNFYINANIGKYKENYSNYYYSNYSENFYSAEIGYLPIPGLLFAVGIEGWDNDWDDDYDPTLRAKYVTPIGNYDLNLEAYTRIREGKNDLELSGDFYLDKTFSIGFGYADNAWWTNEEEFRISAKKFLNPNLSIEGNLNISEFYKEYGARVAYRF